MRYNNKQHGSAAFNYLSNEEFVSANKIANFKVMNAITNITLNKYKPVLLNINKNIATALGETPINVINNVHKNDANRKKILAILRDEESDLIIKEIIDLRNRLEDQSENISQLLEQHLNVSDYASFLKDLSSKTQKFTFLNVDQIGDIPKNLSTIQNFGEKIMEILPEIEGEEVKNKLKKHKKYIQYSISCGMSWKYVDLSKHAIGTLKDIMTIAIVLFDNEGKGNLNLTDIDTENMFRKLYEPYIEEKDRDEFFNSLTFRGFIVPKAVDNTIIIYDNSITEDTLIDSSTYTGPIQSKIDEAIGVATAKEGGLKTGIAQEFLIVVIYLLMINTIQVLHDVAKTFRNFQKRKYNNKYSQIHKNIVSNINIFDKLIDNALNHYFNLDNRDISAYGIDKATLDLQAKPASLGRIAIRVVGGFNKIKGKDKFTPNTYPLIGTFEFQIEKLVNMIGYAPRNDIVDKKPLAIGGFIQEEFIGKTSMKIVHDYFERLLKNKDVNIKYIDTILDKMRRGVHVKDLRNIRIKVENRLKDIGKITDPTSKSIRAKVATQFVGNEYKRLRNYELDNLLSLDMIEATIRNNPNKLATIGKRILKLRDQAFTKFGHYQLKSHAYKTIALGVYQQLMRQDANKYPAEFFGQLHEVFDRMDNKLLQDLSEKASNKYDRLKDKLLERIIEKDIRVFNTTLTPTAPAIKNRRNEYISNINTTLTARDWKIIESKDYWEKVKKKLDGLTVYIPYVDISVLDLGHQHGLFDLVNAAIEGKIKESYLVTSVTDHIIPGSKLDRKTISRRIRAQGTVMVTNGERDIRDTRMWRSMIKSDINEMKKLGAMDLRRKVFNIFANKSTYMMDTPYLWPDNSYTKEKIVLYCKMTFGGDDYYKCALLTSRNRIANKMLGI